MTGTRRVRADAERSTARILEAAEGVLAADPNAPLERIADAAGLARATVHRRFANRTALLTALADQLNCRYELAFDEAEAATDDPLALLCELSHRVFALKIANRFALALADTPGPRSLERMTRLFERLHEAGVIATADPAWTRGVCLALLDEVHRLPADSPALGGGDEISARSELFVRALLGALGAQGRDNLRGL
ncbi:TetR/AcrR family transcriptional regulator [Kineococcus sp. SYSU DK003]|uniref:TetR/AcrR family transcriptional regulator n=1 Tax=Kineococcus sp. SYSU DK003 TaxID=3383124 RepID=UPI003D7DB22A